MRQFINIVENASDEHLVLYHATLRDNVNEIMLNGLQARVGEMVKHFYVDDETTEADLEPLVFAADVGRLQACVNAMAHLIWQVKFNRDPSKRTRAFSMSAIREFGAVCVIEADVSAFEHHDGDYAVAYPHAVEDGDYFSRDAVSVDRVIVGEELISFIDAHGGWKKRSQW